MANPRDVKYTKEHEWVRIEGDSGTVGITDYAQDQLGDVVFVDLPVAGTSVRCMEKFGEIESVKAVSELFSPVTGEVIEANESLNGSPELVNDSPYADGWMMKVRLAEPGELAGLMSADEYEAYLREAAH